MSFDNPILRRPIKRLFESSRLLPRRESTSLQHNWMHIESAVNHVGRMTNNLGQIQRSLFSKNNGGVYQFHPFKVYNVPAPFTGPAVTGFNPATDSWRAFQIKPGYIGVRSKYHTFYGDSGQLAGFVGFDREPIGNFEVPVYVESGTDNAMLIPPAASADFQQESYFNSAGDFRQTIVLSGITTGTPAFPTFPGTTWVLPEDDNGGGGYVGAAFWIKIVDTEDDLYGIIEGRMFDFDVSTVGYSPIFPADDPLTIPLCTIFTQSGALYDGTNPTQLSVWQLQYGHLLNRFPIYANPESNPQCYRGNWDNDSLSGQVFWPGDVVQMNSNDDSMVATFYFQNGNVPAIVTDSPVTDPSPWTLLSGWAPIIDPT